MKMRNSGNERYETIAESVDKDRAAPSGDVKNSHDLCTKNDASSTGTASLDKEGKFLGLENAPKRYYTKPTLVLYGSASDLAKRLGQKFKWSDLFI